jgi:hypothetical protein
VINDIRVGSLKDRMTEKPMVDGLRIRNCKSTDGSPIKIRVIHGKNIDAPGCDVIYYNELLVNACCTWRKIKKLWKKTS